jgi:glucans biosynthesis protein C
VCGRATCLLHENSLRDGERLVFIDALRVSVIALVIVHHAAQAYGPTGGFWPVHDRSQSDWFTPFYTANAAFGMGLMFLLAGYFVPPSYAHKGASGFLRGRWRRIGVPLATFVLLVHLPVVYLVSGCPASIEFIRGLYERGWQPIYLHLWFIADLLLYSVIYVAWRRITPFQSKSVSKRRSPPSRAAIACFMFAVAGTTWLIRIPYPVDRWVPLLWVMPAEAAHLPQYIALFVAGILAYRGDWFRRLPTSTGIIWLIVGLVALGGVYLAYAFGAWNELMTTGGPTLSSLVRSSWETLIVVGLSIGLIVAFRELFNRSNRLIEAMATASFGAYILHPAIVVALQAAIAALPLIAFTKFVIVSVLGTVLAFAVSHLAGNVPGIRGVLGMSG